MIGGTAPDLDAVFAPFSVAATVTIPGLAPVVTVWVEQGPRGDGFPADSGTYSLTKKFRRGSLRLDDLPAATRAGISWPPPETRIDLLAAGGADVTETIYVEGVDYQDEEISHVIVR